MQTTEYRSASPEQTTALGEYFARHYLAAGSVVALFGELGAGKTQFVKGIANAFQIDPRELTSPTFALANEYACRFPFSGPLQNSDVLIHLDCYRFEKPEELLELGIEDYLHPISGVTVIEWAERIEKFLPLECIRVRIEVLSEAERNITIFSQEREGARTQ